jgi:hypothetical protein
MLDFGLIPSVLWPVGVALGTFIGALSGWRIWRDKDRPTWHGAIIGAVLMFALSLIGLLILLIIWSVWNPEPASDPAESGRSHGR